MFGKKKIKSSKIDTLIGQGIEVNGDIKFQGGLHLDGKIFGNVSAKDSQDGMGTVLVISDKGHIEGDVHVAYAIINGTVTGNVYATEKLELSSKACISGNVEYNLLEMASGASINGSMKHETNEKKRLEHKAENQAEDEISEQPDNLHHLEGTAAM